MTEDVRPAHIRLQSSIAKLTRSYRVETKQRPEGGGYKITPIMHPPLLVQLQVMSGSSVGGKNGVTTGTLVIDADAVEKLAAVEKHILASWSMLFPGSSKLVNDSHLSPEHSLALWGEIFEENRVAGFVVESRVLAEATVWANWVRIIESKFSPERTSEFVGDCPKCGNRYVLTTDGDRAAAVKITWRDPVKDSSAKCGFCGFDWTGEGMLRQLAGHARHAETTPFEMAM